MGLEGNVLATDTEGTGLIFHGPYRRLVYDFTPPRRGKKAPHPEKVLEERLICPARPFAFSFSDVNCSAWYHRYQVDPFDRSVAVNKSGDEYKMMQDVLEDETVTKWLHNPRYDLLAYEHIGIQVKGPVLDTQILAHVATAGQEFSYALKPITKKWLDYDDSDEKELRKRVNAVRQKAKMAHWSYAVPTLAGHDPWKADMWMLGQYPDTIDAFTETYATGDSIRTILLVLLWLEAVGNDPNMQSLFEREHDLMWTLKDMEDTGTRVFPETLAELRTFYSDYQSEQAALADAHGAKGLNYGSTAQMAKLFYEERGHPAVHTSTWNKKQNRYNYSLNGEQLVKMADGYAVRERDYHWKKDKETGKFEYVQKTRQIPPDPLATAILEYKAAGQTIGLFLDIYDQYAIEERWVDVCDRHRKICEEAGQEYDELDVVGFYGTPDKYGNVWILHPGYKQTGAVTGRLSCADPNLMQVASETTGRRKSKIQSRPREAFGPRPGCYWYLPDYSQIEVWLFAFASEEEAMQDILLSGRHFHTEIAIKVFGARADFKSNKEYYVKCAKLIMFAKLYGGGINKMASLLKTNHEDAKRFIEQYEAELPGVNRFMKRMINRAMRDGVIYNPFGRRYEFSVDFAYRSVNYLIQGTAADVMKNALIRINRMLKQKWPHVRLLLTIHDEIIVEVPAVFHSRELMRDVVREMQGDQELLKLPVPLPVEMKVVRPDGRWNKTHKYSKRVNDDIGAYTKAA